MMHIGDNFTRKFYLTHQVGKTTDLLDRWLEMTTISVKVLS